MDHRNIVLTGLPRSGTTLACYLLNKVPDTVALSESYTPKKSVKLQGEEALCDGLDHFFRRMRRMIRTRRVAVSKQIGGKVPDNPFGGERDATGLRKQLASKGEIAIDKDLGRNFALVIKAPGLFATLLPGLAKRFPSYAIIRNPLAVLASWHSLEEGTRNWQFPLAEMYDAELARQLAVEVDGIGRQLCLMSWFYERFDRELPEESILRYEEIVASRGRSLATVVPAARGLNETLSNYNMNPLYDREVMDLLGERLLDRDGAFWRFYSRESVEELLG
jgi:hypothetical protein